MPNRTKAASLVAILAAVAEPTISTPVTPSDSTDLTTVASKGLHLSIALGSTITLVYKRLDDVSARTEIFSSDCYVWGKFARVMAATVLNGNTIVALS